MDPEATWGEAIDPVRADELRSLRPGANPSTLSQLAKIFLSEGPAKLTSLRSAVLEGGALPTERAAHYLRGAAATIGATRMAAICGELEVLSRSGDLSDARDLVERLDVEFGRVRAALAAELERDGLRP